MDYGKCKGGLVKSKTLSECFSEQKVPKGIKGPVVVKIPVVLAEPIIQVDVESVIELEEPAVEIKRIKKNLFITQCKVVNIGCGKTAKLFLSGFVRKNIEYATADCHSYKGKSISGDIKHTTVEVPFSCVTKVCYDTPPKFFYQPSYKEASLYFEEKKDKTCCEYPVMGSNPCEQAFEHSECFNEEIFCELVESKIYEVDIHKVSKEQFYDKDDRFDYDNTECCEHKNYCEDKEYYDKNAFDKIIEKMVIFVKIKLLQNQQVSITNTHSATNDISKKYYK